MFGASSHKYKTGAGMPLHELKEFQKSHNLSFPPDFEAFLLAFGFPIGTNIKAIAGPFYGIFNLGFERAIIPDGSQSFLSRESVLSPNMSTQLWEKLINDMPDENGAYDAYERNLMSGIYTLGEQGCANYHALVLTGDYRGKVVNLDIEFYVDGPPRFAFEDNFLDWYERWLDEVISGVIVLNKGYWFGYVMRGTEEELLEVISKAQTEKTKINALNGFSILSSVKKSTSEKLYLLVENEKGEVKNLALKMLTKFEPNQVVPHLTEMIASNDADCKIACETIFRHAKTHANNFSENILERLTTIDDDETYRFAMYVLEEVEADYSEFIAQGLSHSNSKIRASSAYQLGKQKFRPDFAPDFIKGLRDTDHTVVHASLRALKGSKDIRLLQPYYEIATSYAWDDTHVLANLEHRLDEVGFRSVTYFKRCYEDGNAQAQFKKYTSGGSVLNLIRQTFSK